MPYFVSASLVLALVAVAGCGNAAEGEATESEAGEGKNRGGVAVVDLDVLAKELGKQDEIDRLLKHKRLEYSQHLATLQAKYEKHIAAKTKEYGETPNVDQIRVLNTIKQTAVIKYGQEKQAVRIGIQQYRLELVKELRSQVAPIAEKIAEERGFDVVIPNDKSLLLSVRPKADITKDVIARMKKQQPKPLVVPKDAKPAPMPGKK